VGGAGKLRHRVDVRHVDPVRAAIVRDPEGARVGQAAAADALLRLDDEHATPGVTQASRGRDAGRARAHDQHVHKARDCSRCGGGRREGRHRCDRSGTDEECAAAETRHG
jgi:hypothetical protein